MLNIKVADFGDVGLSIQEPPPKGTLLLIKTKEETGEGTGIFVFGSCLPLILREELGTLSYRAENGDAYFKTRAPIEDVLMALNSLIAKE
jgi:hypothetical protein